MPFESQAQRALAHAVASGKAKNASMTKAAAERMIADDPGGKLPAKKVNPGRPDHKKRVSSGLNKALAASLRKENMQGT